MSRLFCLLLLLTVTAPLMAVTLTVKTDAAVSLSLAQEAENAIDRAQRWVKSQPCECTNATQTLLHKYALFPKGEDFKLSEQDVALLKKALPPAIVPVNPEELPQVIELLIDDPKALYALQQSLPTAEAPTGWRETFVRALVNAQQVTPTGGYWQDPPATLWAILTLRALLNESIPVTITPPTPTKL